MPNPNEVVVTVTMEGDVPKCEPEWVRLFWRKNQTVIRWRFDGIPPRFLSAGIEFLDTVPAKYADGTPGFLGDPVFNGIAFRRSSTGSHLPDIVTVGHKQRKGYFCYDVILYPEHGEPVRTDPGGSNDPNEPPSPTPGG